MQLLKYPTVTTRGIKNMRWPLTSSKIDNTAGNSVEIGDAKQHRDAREQRNGFTYIWSHSDIKVS